MKTNSRHFILFSTSALALAGCSCLDRLTSSPAVSPDDFLRSAPWLSIHLSSLDFILCQPTSTVIVYFVGLFAIYAGYRFLSDTTGSKSKLYWGIGLCLTGAGALSAGTSYQAFGYQLKCAGRDTCTFTSWCEVIYMLLSVPGMSAFLIAGAYSSARGIMRRTIITYACINAIVYTALLLYGALLPLRFLVSFDFFVLMSLPSVLILLAIYTRIYSRDRDSMHLFLRNTWLIFAAVSVAYYSYMLAGISPRLWQQGIWFSEKDVLHAGMIIWVYYIITKLPAQIQDLAE